MSSRKRRALGRALAGALGLVLAGGPGVALAAAPTASGAAAPATAAAPGANSAPNPYRRIDGFLQMPDGRHIGSTTAVGVDHQGHLWIAERCGANSCADSKLDPIMEFDADGHFIKAFGAGMLLFPHGFFIDRDDHIWVTDGHVGGGKGDDVLEFDRDGRLLRTLGKPGVSGDGPDTFHEPNAVVIAPNGDIFVSDGHEPGLGNARVVRFDRDGRFVRQWGGHGSGPGQLEAPHALAIDSAGRIFVGDRGNNRVQVFDQDGKFLASWDQFSRPSGMYIDAHDVLYVSDSESRNVDGYGHHPGWRRGIRIGSAKDGVVTAFIPDPEPDPDHNVTSAGEGVTVDGRGNIYGAEVGTPRIVKYARK